MQTNYEDLTIAELARLEAIAHNEGNTDKAAMLAEIERLRGIIEDMEERQTLEEWDKANGPASDYYDFFHDCFKHLGGHYPSPSVTSDYDKSVIFDAIRKGEGVTE